MEKKHNDDKQHYPFRYPFVMIATIISLAISISMNKKWHCSLTLFPLWQQVADTPAPGGWTSRPSRVEVEQTLRKWTGGVESETVEASMDNAWVSDRPREPSVRFPGTVLKYLWGNFLTEREWRKRIKIFGMRWRRGGLWCERRHPRGTVS